MKRTRYDFYDMRVVLRLATALLLLSCAPPEDPRAAQADVQVDLREYRIAFARGALRAGAQTIFVRNRGTLAHDFIILRTDAPPDQLQIDGARAKEEGRVAATRSLGPARGELLTVDLAPGTYVIICNEPGHYALQMRTGVTVP